MTDYTKVALLGIFDPKGEKESFCYSVNSPVNLWVSAVCTDGSRMGVNFMGYVLNELIDADCFDEGSSIVITTQSDVQLKATVGEWVPKKEVEAFQALTPMVRKVQVTPVPSPTS